MPIGRIGFNEFPKYGSSMQDNLLRALQAYQSRKMFPEQLQAAQLGNQQTQQMMPLQQALAELKNRQMDLGNRRLESELPYAGELARAGAAYKSAMANYLSSPNQSLKGLSALGKTYIEPHVLAPILNRQQAMHGMPQGIPEEMAMGPMGQEQAQQPLPPIAMEPEGKFEYRPEDYAFEDKATGRREGPGGVPIQQGSPNPGGSMADYYQLNRQKLTSDTQARNRNLFATNIEKTISYIDPEALTQFGGLKGQVKLQREKALASVGKESEAYDKYVESLNAVKLMTKQMRQFYGDSIQPHVQENLEKLNNPSTWSTNPRLARRLFDQTKDILENELGTYRQALRSPQAYQQTGMMGGRQAARGSGGMVEVISPEGKILRGPSDKIEEFLKAHQGYKRK